MRSLSRLAAIVAAGVLSCMPLAAQTMVKDSSLPAAVTLTGTEGLRAVQGSGCPTSVSPCANVRVTPVQLASYMTSTGLFQASDIDLTAIAALATQGYGRTLLTMPDAPTTRAYLGLGSNALDSTPRAPAARLINTAAPLTGGGDLSADRTLGISLATGVSAGAMSAGDKGKLDSVNTGASVSSVTCTGTGGISCSVTSGTTAAQVTIAPGALTPASVAATGTVTGSNLSGTNTGDQTLAGLGGQPLAPNLTALSGLNTAADNCAYWTGSATAALYSCPGYGRSLLGSTSASVAQATLGLGSAALASTGASGHVLAFLDGANTYSGAMSFTQIINGSISGSAPTLTTGRTFAFTGDIACTSAAFNGSANISTACTLVNSTTARADLGAAASGNNNDITGFSNNLRLAGRAYVSPQSSAGAGPEQPTLGSALTTSPLILTDYTGQYGLATGVSSTTGNVWLQSQRFDNSGSIYNLILQPVGGNVLIGTGTAVQKLTVGGGIAGSVVQLTVAGTVANLGTCNAAARGTRTVVTDATAPTFLGTLNGGGSVVSPAFCNGSAWVAG